MPDRLILFEFPDEVDAYLKQYGRHKLDSPAAQVISLDPKVQAHLATHGIESDNSQSYFSSGSHSRALLKSHELLDWLASRFRTVDALGLEKTYSQALLWYSRYTLHHLLWLSEVLSSASIKHPGATFVAALVETDGEGSPMIQQAERYLGHLAKQLAVEHDLPFQEIEMGFSQVAKPSRRLWPEWLKNLGIQVGAKFHRQTLRRMAHHQPLLTLSHGNRMDALVGETRREVPELDWVVRGEISASMGHSEVLRQGWRAMFGNMVTSNGHRYLGEVWPQALAKAQRGDPEFLNSLGRALDYLSEEIHGDTDTFSHQGIRFGNHYASKLLSGIRTALIGLHSEVLAIDEMLCLLRPRLVTAPFGRRFSHALGQLAQRRGIPGVLISHGSFTPMKCELEKMAWDFHSDGLFHGSYSHSVLQSPLSEAFARQVSSSTSFVKTGPLAWGVPADQADSKNLRSRVMGKHQDCKVVVHAGTPKFRSGIHFHVYETTDEYVTALQELVSAVNALPGVFLIIKFRPGGLNSKELQSLLPDSDRCYISVEEPFPVILGIADLLVSFSSTTIEEALQNRVPVLLYGGDGRYQHVMAPDANPEKSLEPSPVYALSGPNQLARGLDRILHLSNDLPCELFDQYIYPRDAIISFPQLVRSLVDTGEVQTVSVAEPMMNSLTEVKDQSDDDR